jgi:hypothetical protein
MAPIDRVQIPFPTNLSRSISLSIFDLTEQEISLQAMASNPIHLYIPRDPSLSLPHWHRQNVTLSAQSKTDRRLFNLHFVNLTYPHPMALHFHLLPLNLSRAYLIIYKFNATPHLNRTSNQTDGWHILCPQSQLNIHASFFIDHSILRTGLHTDGFHSVHLDQHHVRSHASIVFGVRELTDNEVQYSCSARSMSAAPPMIDEPLNFTCDYSIRAFSSGCFYLDDQQRWQINGLTVR